MIVCLITRYHKILLDLIIQNLFGNCMFRRYNFYKLNLKNKQQIISYFEFYLMINILEYMII